MRTLSRQTGTTTAGNRAPLLWIVACARWITSVWMLYEALCTDAKQHQMIGLDAESMALKHLAKHGLEREIKNVITVIAKTNHYWEEHVAGAAPARLR